MCIQRVNCILKQCWVLVPLSPRLIIVTGLFISSVTSWIILLKSTPPPPLPFPCIVKPLMSLLREVKIWDTHSYPGIKVVFTRLFAFLSMITTANCWMIALVFFSNALGHKLLYRLIQSNMASFEGSDLKISVGYLFQPPSLSPVLSFTKT